MICAMSTKCHKLVMLVEVKDDVAVVTAKAEPADPPAALDTSVETD